jgi:hypothetical protein
MKNPWLDLPTLEPYVLEADRDLVEKFNITVEDKYKFLLNLMPEPYCGRLDAPIVLLASNPGVGPDDARLHQDEGYRSTIRFALENRPLDYPVFHLDPARDSDGAKWWKRILKRPIQDFGAKRLSNNILYIQQVGYHSAFFRVTKSPLPSQAYTKIMLMKKMADGANIIVMRGFRLWLLLVPELAAYDKLFRLNSYGNVAITPNNMGSQNAYDELWSVIGR